MRVARLRRVLTSPDFVAELRHLLARPPGPFGNRLDAGTMCRDSAVLVATIAARLGMTAQVCLGQAAIFGHTAAGPLCLHFRSHAWAHVAGYGICDLSVDLRDGAPPGWVGSPAQFLAGSRYHPRDAIPLAYHTDGDRFAADVARHRVHPNGYRAIYLEQERRPFDYMMFVGAVDFAQSVLTRDLAAQRFFSLNILGKAAVHLWRVTKGRAESLARLDQAAAWAAVGAIDNDTVDKFRMCLRFGFSLLSG
jgi:hypothetical protein